MAKINYEDLANEKILNRGKEIDASTGKSVDLINKTADESIRQAESSVKTKTEEANREYRDTILRADLQKELDLKDIRETRANMGLSRSGISATEQTAAILSAGNKAAKADRQRLAAIDALNQSLIDHKNSVNLQRQSDILSAQQAAEDQKRTYADTWSQWGLEQNLDVSQTEESNRRTTLSAMGLDTATLATAIDDGWTVEQAAEYLNQQNTARENELLNAMNNGQISDHVHKYALANKLTLNEALAFESEQKQAEKESVTEYTLGLIQSGLLDPSYYTKVMNGEVGMGEILQAASAASTKQDIADFAQGLYENGLISPTTYTKAQNGTIDIAGIVTESEAYKKKLASQTTTVDWTDAIDNLYNNNNGAISPETYSLAITNKWDPQQTMEYQRQYVEGKNAIDDGKLDQDKVDLSLELNIPIPRSLELSQHALTAKKMIKNIRGRDGIERVSRASVYDALDYIGQVSKSYNELTYLINSVGISEEEYKAYAEYSNYIVEE